MFAVIVFASVLAFFLRAARAAAAGACAASAATCASADAPRDEVQGPSLLQKSNRPRIQLQQVGERRALSSVSSQWHDKVVYGVFTSSIPAYHDKLAVQLETWAARPAREGRYVAVGGSDFPEEWQVDNVVLKSGCGDFFQNLSCKEWNIVAEASGRSASWLVVLGEDNYVDTQRVEEFLARNNPEDPVAFGCVGCGKELYCKDTMAFMEHGGLCGGCGYFLSRAALRVLADEGAFYNASDWPNDMTTSCLLRRHGVQLQNIGGPQGKGLHGWQHTREILKERLQSSFMTLHYLTPAVMRWVHAVVSNSSQGEVSRLESVAFNPAIA